MSLWAEQVGLGSGLDVRHCSPAVTGVTAVEPSDVAWRLSAPERERSAVPVRRAGLDGQQLPFDGCHVSRLFGSLYEGRTVPAGS